MGNCVEMLEARWAEGKHVCVGLDSDLGRLPASLRGRRSIESSIVDFNVAVIESTCDTAAAYKPNLAFYLRAGWRDGLAALEATIKASHRIAPAVPVILDAKWGDIGNTNYGYVDFGFDELQADAVTLHPYLGYESLQPFLRHEDKMCFILCRTSNPGAPEFQDLLTKVDDNDELGPYKYPLYLDVAQKVANTWNENGNCGLVTGATYPAELAYVRRSAPRTPLLIPGIGAQGGDVKATVEAAKHRFVINSSSGIIFASSGEDFAEAARAVTLELHNEINKYRPAS